MVGVHLVGGIVGSLLLGVLAEEAIGGVDGLLYGNGPLLWYQFVGVVAVMAFSFVATYAIAKLVDRTIGLRATAESEISGLDISLHEERGYVLTDAN